MTTHHDIADPLLTTKEVAELLRVEQGTVRWWRHVGRGPQGITLPGGRRVLYRRSAVDAFIAEGEAAATQTA